MDIACDYCASAFDVEPAPIYVRVECPVCRRWTPFRQASGRDLPLNSQVFEERAAGKRGWERPWPLLEPIR